MDFTIPVRASYWALAMALLLAAGCSSPKRDERLDPENETREPGGISVGAQLVRLEPGGPLLAGVQVEAVKGDEIVASSMTNSTGFATLSLAEPGNHTLRVDGLAAGFFGSPVRMNLAGDEKSQRVDILVLDRFKSTQEALTLPPGAMWLDDSIILDRKFVENARLQAAYAKGLESLLVQIAWNNSASSWADLDLGLGAGNQGYSSQNEEHGPTTPNNVEEERVEGAEARILAGKATESFWIWVFTEDGIVLPPGLNTTIIWDAAFAP